MPLEWDDDNEGHLVRHGILASEAEQALNGPVVRLHGGTDKPTRVRMLGRTAGGRYLMLVVEERAGDILRPITGREMRPHEREIYGRQSREE